MGGALHEMEAPFVGAEWCRCGREGRVARLVARLTGPSVTDIAKRMWRLRSTDCKRESRPTCDGSKRVLCSSHLISTRDVRVRQLG